MTETNHPVRTESRLARMAQALTAIRKAYALFLALPTAVVTTFLAIAIATYAIDRNQGGWLAPLWELVQAHLFAEPDATTQVLSTIAGGMITVTSITFSLLLVALQQSAGSMTHAVFDQFLRRRLNQVYAGSFVGVTLYALVTLATVSPEFNPVFGATLSLLFAIGALYVLLLLIYSAIEQMRPSAILEAIHDHTLQARERQLPLLQRTRRHPEHDGPVHRTVRAPNDGFVTAIDLDVLQDALKRSPHAAIALQLPIGGYAAFHDPLAAVSGASEAEWALLAEAVERAVRLDRERDLDRDPSFGIEQIETIAWTTISTSKQDPNPGLEASRNLRDLLARWAAADDEDDGTAGEPLAVVYPDDVFERLFGTIESLTVVASESMQHQLYADMLRGLATLLDRLPPPLARRSEEVVLRGLAGLGDHVLTAELEGALTAMADALEQAGLAEGAAAVRAAHAELATTVGHLSSRATRVSEK